MTLAEMIVKVLDAVNPSSSRYGEEEQDRQVAVYAQAIQNRYQELKRHKDFSTASHTARVEVVEKIIQKFTGA